MVLKPNDEHLHIHVNQSYSSPLKMVTVVN